MKYFLSLIVFLFSFNVMAQPVEKEVSTKEAQATFEKVVDKIVDVMGTGYKATKEEIKPLAAETVKQFVAMKVMTGIFCLVGIVICIIAMLIAYRLIKWSLKRDVDCEPAQIFGIIGFICLAVATMVCFCMAANAFIDSVSPYIAILDLFRTPRCGG